MIKISRWTMGAVGAVLAAIATAGGVGWYLSDRRVAELEGQLAELQRQEKRAVVLRSVSAQLEEIAYEQKAISDEQREEALRQTRLANEMRERSEMERQNAINAQNNALASERKALDAYGQAEQQRQMAEHQRIQAELSKRVADTLSYVALGRSLGSLALAQWESGNREEACLLSYASYHYTQTYRGNIYYPSVYQALSQCSQSMHSWTEHEGAVTDIDFSAANPQQLVAVTNYGEVSVLDLEESGKRKVQSLLRDSRYDFRNSYVRPTTGDIYVIDRNGQLLRFSGKRKETLGQRPLATVGTQESGKWNVDVLPIKGILHPFALENFKDDRRLLVVGEDGLAELDMETNTVITQKKLDFRAVYVSRYDYSPVVFDNKGVMHIVRTIDRLESKKVPVPGQVTAFASSKNQHYEAYGMDNGTIFLVDSDRKVHRLVGHRSRISKLKTNGARLYSSSYDGTVNLWMTNSLKMEPMTLLSVNSWIMNFTFDTSKNYLWVCDRKGVLSEALISVQMMAEQVRRSLTRGFTDEEWNYYIGKNIPKTGFALNDQ